MKKIYPLLLLIGLALSIVACNKDADKNYNDGYYSFEDYKLLMQYLNLPETPPDFTPQPTSSVFFFPSKPLNRDMATLGKVLFYDKNLSKDGKVACANCHKQEFAFGDNSAASTGVFDRVGERNSIALMSVTSFSAQYGENSFGGKRFFWDNRAATAVEQSIGSMTNPKEMDMTMEEVVDAVEAQPYYAPLFSKAFGDARVSEGRVTNAIAEFVNAIGSFDSRFDFAIADAQQKGVLDFINNYLPQLSATENKGKSLYMLNCASCHSFDMFSTMRDQASNGLDAVTTDPGIGAITGFQEEYGTFKIPSLRNVAKSAPYMHDGRFATLEAVIEHYSSGVQSHPNLDFSLKNADGSPKHLNLSQEDKQALVAFLNTLTDDGVLTDVRFSNPFKE